jgi:hypothetical protein
MQDVAIKRDTKLNRGDSSLSPRGCLSKQLDTVSLLETGSAFVYVSAVL